MLTAADIMTHEVHQVPADTTIEEMARLFVERGVSAMPVVDKAGVLVGIITESDLVAQNKPLHVPTVISLFDWVLYLESEKNFQEEVSRITARTVGDICTREVVTCTPESTLPEIAERMSRERVNLLPVLTDGKVIGVVSRHDVVRAMSRA